jgi:hypothetical protein
MMKKKFRIFYLEGDRNGSGLLPLPTASGDILFSFDTEEAAINHFRTYYQDMHKFEIAIIPVFEVPNSPKIVSAKNGQQIKATP